MLGKLIGPGSAWARLRGQPRMVEADPSVAPHLRIPPVPEQVARYLVEGMHEIPGWGLTAETARLVVLLDAWQKERGVRGSLLEIGVHHGRSAILLALLAGRGETTVLVDLFERQGENIDRSGMGDRAILEANLARWCPEAQTQIVQANSLDLDFGALSLTGGLRLAHIDGGHHIEAVLNDLRKTAAALVPDGILLIDDFLHLHWPEVMEGCYAFLAQTPQVAAVSIGWNKMVMASAGSADDLRAWLSARIDPARITHVRVRQEPCLAFG